MKLRSIISGILLLILTISCNNRPITEKAFSTVDVASNIKNIRQINLSQFSDNITYVALENREDIGMVNGLSDVSNDRLLTHDTETKSLLLFDKSGHLITKFGKVGRGPEEYIYINNLCFGIDNKIYFNSNVDLLEFNPDGSFSKKYPKSIQIENKLYLHQWRMLGDSLIFGHIENNSGQTKYKAILINKFGKVKRYYPNYDLLEFRGSRVVGGFTQIFKFKGTLYFKEQFIDTLFSLNSDYKLIPEYCFNMGDLKMPASLRVNFREYFEKINSYVAITGIFQTEDYLFLNVNLGNRFPARRLTLKPKDTRIPSELVISVNELNESTNTTVCLGIYDKKTGELIFCKPTNTDNPLFTSGIYNDIDGGPRFLPMRQINDSTMVMAVSAKDLKNHIASDDFKNSKPKYPEMKKQLEKLANSLTEFDNPVVMFVIFNHK